MNKFLLAGFGWAIIKLKRLEAYHKMDLVPDKLLQYFNVIGSLQKIRVSLNRSEIFSTKNIHSPRSPTKSVGQTVISPKIWKKSTKIQVLVLSAAGSPILDLSGTVDSYLKNSEHCTEALKKRVPYGDIEYKPNCIVVDVIWLDEREQTHREPLKLSDDIKDRCAKE